jgi:hypothetical protein
MLASSNAAGADMVEEYMRVQCRHLLSVKIIAWVCSVLPKEGFIGPSFVMVCQRIG